MVEIRVLTAIRGELLTAVRQLLDAAFAGDFSEDDWCHALGGHHVVALHDRQPVAHAAVVPRELEFGDRTLHGGYVEAVATAPGWQGRGLGARVMAEVGRIIRNGYAVGMLATGAHDFYARQGWERWRGPTFARTGDRRRRTEDDDDALMVLRFGASRDLPLTAPITCQARPGDDW